MVNISFLQDTETSMEEAAEKLDEAKEAVFEDLENQTGTTPSSTGGKLFSFIVMAGRFPL